MGGPPPPPPPPSAPLTMNKFSSPAPAVTTARPGFSAAQDTYYETEEASWSGDQSYSGLGGESREVELPNETTSLMGGKRASYGDDSSDYEDDYDDDGCCNTEGCCGKILGCPGMIVGSFLTVLQRMCGCGNRGGPEFEPVIEEELLTKEQLREIKHEAREGVKNACFLIIGTVAICISLIWLKFLLIPMVLARFFVYMFQPLINYMIGKKYIFHRKIRCHIPREIAVLVCICLVIFVVWLILVLIYFSVAAILNDSQKYLNQADLFFTKFLEWAESQGFDRAEIIAMLPSISVSQIGVLIYNELVHFIPDAFLTVLFAIYMLLSYNETRLKSPIQKEVDNVVRKYIIIKTFVSICVASISTVIYLIFHVDLAFLFGFFSFLVHYIPNIGPLLAVFLPMPVVLFDPNQTWWSIMLVFLLPAIAALFFGHIVDPMLTGHQMEISPVSVLACLAFWGAVWGLVGAFISVPLTVAIRLYLQASDHPMLRFVGECIGSDYTFFHYDDSYAPGRKVVGEGEKEE